MRQRWAHMQKLWAELLLPIAASCFPGSGRSLGSGEHQRDVWSAGHCPANSCSTKNGTFRTSFCSCFYTVWEISHRRYRNQRMAASPGCSEGAAGRVASGCAAQPGLSAGAALFFPWDKGNKVAPSAAPQQLSSLSVLPKSWTTQKLPK